MTVSFPDFLDHLAGNPVLCITVALTLGVVLVNGWIDAPNAIATGVSTRAIKPYPAIIMAVICNFLGVFVMTFINANVAETIYHMVDFGSNYHDSLIALCAAMIAIVIWAMTAWFFGIPTSESHALIAGLSGAAIAMQNSFSGINAEEWVKVIYGLFLSAILGFLTGWAVVRIVEYIFRMMDRQKTSGFFKNAQVAGAAAMSFMHGAQDGQKFMGVFMLGMFMAEGVDLQGGFRIPVWLMILCSLIMGLGTCFGGYKIIKAVGMNVVKLQQYQGFAADLAGALSLLFCSLCGLPVSSTQTKTTAIMGVGASKRLTNVNWGAAKEMVFTWILTFPGCGLIAYLITKLFLHIF
ncbi:inorganic phosphate transporter [Diplocloster modestus]|uniref:Inorganic phosphate transporter n=1 Tax=Diplocloster modestus TaxID=2850322 RepID=A0ABS6K0Z4_9FIRM|nr:inorganic phosphate transporter [Diplocloster modestus]MBU9724523.1 inorganic phosphate transporter [Diplocloster modestus]